MSTNLYTDCSTGRHLNNNMEIKWNVWTQQSVFMNPAAIDLSNFLKWRLGPSVPYIQQEEWTSLENTFAPLSEYEYDKV